MKRVFVIVGPTGVGKTKLSIELAKRCSGEIINADAMQVYKGLNIGTAKISEKEKEGVCHHLFDIKDVSDDYSIYQYQRDCRNVIEEIFKRGHTPILVGGTGLYIKSALYDYQLDENHHINSYDDLSTDELYHLLLRKDKDIEGYIDKNNRRRIINAICYYDSHSESIRYNKTNKLLYDVVFIGLTTDRERLYSIINQRVDDMISNGLVEEVKYFYDKKIFSKPLLGGIGYKELYQYFDGNIQLEEAISFIKRNSRRYAKRQYTFFNHQMPVKWFQTDYDCFDNTVRDVLNYIDNLS